MKMERQIVFGYVSIVRQIIVMRLVDIKVVFFYMRKLQFSLKQFEV